MDKIETLTPDQEAMMPVVRKAYRDEALRTDRIHRGDAIKAVNRLYKAGGLDEPIVLFAASPVEALLIRGVIMFAPDDTVEAHRGVMLSLGDAILRACSTGRDEGDHALLRVLMDKGMDPEMPSQVHAAVEADNGAAVDLIADIMATTFSDLGFDNTGASNTPHPAINGRAIMRALFQMIGTEGGDRADAQPAMNLISQLRMVLPSIINPVLAAPRHEMYQPIWFSGAADGYWLAFYDFVRQIGLKYDDKTDEHLSAYIEYAKHCGQAFMYEQVAIISDRAECIRYDDRDLLHGEDGPAVRYRDGFEVYSWHGTRIPNDWQDGSNGLTPEKALTWNNMEQRRCACEIIGWVNILEQLDAKVIDKHPNPEIGTLVEVDLPDNGPARFVKVQCGTGRTFAIPTDMSFDKAADAVADTYGMTGEEYLAKMEVRT